MPSHLHEALLLLFRNRPRLAPELLRDALAVQLPPHSDVRIESADLTDLQPATYRADLVVLLSEGTPVLGIVVEVQLQPDPDKRFSWPVYVAGLRARVRCPVCLLVVTADEAVARWATQPIDLGGANRFVPLVLGPSAVPEITDAETARADPELAVLSAMAHGHDLDPDKAVRIVLAAMAASVGLDAERATLYFDLVAASMSAAAREALHNMDPAKYEYQSEFARHYVAQGRSQGRSEGRVELLLKQLRSRFGVLPAEEEALLRAASPDELDGFAERVLTAATLEEIFGRPPTP